MKKTGWVDKLNDSDIRRILKKDLPVKEIPFFLDKKLAAMINDRENVALGKSRESKKYFFRFAMSLALFCIIILSSYLIFIYNKSKLNSCIVYNTTGNSYIIEDKSKIKLKTNDRLKENVELLTEEKASIELKIGNESFLAMNENSKIKIAKLYKDKNKEINNILIDSGNVDFNLKMLSKESSFEVESFVLKLIAFGTKFNINVENDKTTQVNVIDGPVFIKPKFEIRHKLIEKIDKNFNKKINNAITELKILNSGESIKISINELKDNEKNIQEIINQIEEKLKANLNDKAKLAQILNDSEKSRLLEEINRIKDSLLRNINIKENNKEKILKFTSMILPEKVNAIFTEKNTAITSDNRTIYISSDSNGAVYSIDSANGRLKWKYSDNTLSDITSPAAPFNNNIILSTPANIMILDKSGNVKNIQKVENGTKYWAMPVIAENKIFIPASQKIYTFDGETINTLENFPESLGQLYITYFDKCLIFADSNENKVKIFSLVSNKITWESKKILDRIFCPPVIANGSIFITDYKAKIYKFDYNINTEPETLNIDGGAVSNMVIANNKIYLVANSGWFYMIDAENFKIAKKVIKIDFKPDYDNYLTKKLLFCDDFLYFCSDTGMLFYYDIANEKPGFINFNNKEKNPLTGTPVKINEAIFTVDVKGTIYKVTKTYE